MSRIVVYGVSGAGKSTLARRVGERLGIPYHAIDDLTWEPGWVEVSDEVQRERVAAVCATDAWVIDAAYVKWAELPLSRATLIVGLDLPAWLSFTRLIRRTVTNIVLRRPLCNGNHETWRGSVLTRDSILRLHLGSHRRKRARMRQWQTDPALPETVVLRSRAEVERWFAALR